MSSSTTRGNFGASSIRSDGASSINRTSINQNDQESPSRWAQATEQGREALRSFGLLYSPENLWRPDKAIQRNIDVWRQIFAFQREVLRGALNRS